MKVRGVGVMHEGSAPGRDRVKSLRSGNKRLIMLFEKLFFLIPTLITKMKMRHFTRLFLVFLFAVKL